MASPRPAENGKQPVGFGGRQAGRGLIENEQLRIGRECARDRHQLPLGRTDVAEIRIERQIEAGLARDQYRLVRDRAPRDEQAATAVGKPVEQQRIGHGQAGNAGPVGSLMNRDDTAGDRLPRSRRPKGLSIQKDFAGVGRDHASEDVHQRRFSGPVRAHQANNLAGCHAELDIVESNGRTKAFRHAVDLQPVAGTGLRCQRIRLHGRSLLQELHA